MNFKYYKVKPLIFVIISLSILFDFLLNFLENLDFGFFKTPSNLALIFLFLELYDKKLWGLPFLKLLVSVPDFSGRYKGKLTSDFKKDDKNVVKDCVLEIVQNASSIKLFMYFDDKNILNRTKSESILEVIKKGNDGFFTICFNYQNPGTNKKDTIGIHDGYNELKYQPDKKTLKGSYYTSPERCNQGFVELEFESKKIKGGF